MLTTRPVGAHAYEVYVYLYEKIFIILRVLNINLKTEWGNCVPELLAENFNGSFFFLIRFQ